MATVKIKRAAKATVISEQSVSEDRHLRAMIHAKNVKTTDRKKFDEACKKFREIVADIKKEIIDESFDGAYEKIYSIKNPYEQFYDSENGAKFAFAFEMKLRRLLAIDQECRYQGSKLGYVGSEWFKKCWEAK